MRLTWALLTFLEAAVAIDSYGAVSLGACVNNVGCAGFYRALGVSTYPPNSDFVPTSNVTGVSVAAIGAQAASNGATTAARVDVAGIKFKTPADTSDGGQGALSFYFGYLGVAGTWDNTTKTGSVAGAVAEVISVLGSIVVYYDNDNAAGFKWDITQTDSAKKYDIFDNAAGEKAGYDTLDIHGTLDLANNLTWTPIDHAKVQCNTQTGLTDSPDTCVIHSLTTTGSYRTATVITITARIATHPILINGNRHGPDRIKFDVRVQYPWTAMSSALYNSTRAKLGLISFAAGKSGAFAGTVVKRSDSSDSLVFASGSNYMAYYAYKQTAKVDGVDAPVTTQVITGQQITDFTCDGPCAGPLGVSVTSLVAIGLKLKVGWLKAFGWQTSLALHALGTTSMPVDVVWDPETGSTTTTPGTNSAAFAAPSLLLLLAIFLW
jgi:hypothetical protein